MSAQNRTAGCTTSRLGEPPKGNVLLLKSVLARLGEEAVDEEGAKRMREYFAMSFHPDTRWVDG